MIFVVMDNVAGTLSFALTVLSDVTRGGNALKSSAHLFINIIKIYRALIFN